MSLSDPDRLIAQPAGFSPREAAASPVAQFGLWFEQTRAAGVRQPRAMSLATVNAQGRPTARMVVLAGFDERGFDFATDSRSPKIEDARRQPWVALVFYWAEMDRQVRIEGELSELDGVTADAYFHKRARESQIATWVGRQSEVVPGRAVLEERFLELLTGRERQPISRPPHYLAYRVRPAMVEFWQARSDQLHDRVRYLQTEPGAWTIERLAP